MSSLFNSNLRPLSWRSAFRALQAQDQETLTTHLDANQLADLLAGRAPVSAWRHLSLCEACRLAAILAAGGEQPARLQPRSPARFHLTAMPSWLPATAALLLIGSAIWWRVDRTRVIQSPAPASRRSPARRVLALPRLITAPSIASTVAQLSAVRLPKRYARRMIPTPASARPPQSAALPRNGFRLATSHTTPAAQTWVSEQAYGPRPSLTLYGANTAPAPAPSFNAAKSLATNTLIENSPSSVSGITGKMALASNSGHRVALPTTLMPQDSSSHGIFTPLFSIRRLGMPILQATWNQALMGTGHAITQMDFARASREMQPLNTLVANAPAGLLINSGASAREVSSSLASPHWRIWHGQLQRSLVGQRYWEPISAGKARFSSFYAAGSILWAGTEDGRLFFTPDGGRHWQVWQLRNSAGQPVHAVIRGLRLQGQSGELHAQGLTWRTRDGGLHWSVR